MVLAAGVKQRLAYFDTRIVKEAGTFHLELGFRTWRTQLQMLNETLILAKAESTTCPPAAVEITQQYAWKVALSFFETPQASSHRRHRPPISRNGYPSLCKLSGSFAVQAAHDSRADLWRCSAIHRERHRGFDGRGVLGVGRAVGGSGVPGSGQEHPGKPQGLFVRPHGRSVLLFPSPPASAPLKRLSCAGRQ